MCVLARRRSQHGCPDKGTGTANPGQKQTAQTTDGGCPGDAAKIALVPPANIHNIAR